MQVHRPEYFGGDFKNRGRPLFYTDIDHSAFKMLWFKRSFTP